MRKREALISQLRAEEAVIENWASNSIIAVSVEKERKLAAVRDLAMIEIRKADHEVNAKNQSIDSLFILAQHDGSKWAEDFRRVKDLCRATRAETGLWSAMTRVHFGPKRRTLLMYESQSGCQDRVQWLLARAAPRDARDADGRTAVFFACREGRTASLLSLIASGAGVNIAKNDGWTPLWVASLNGHIDIVRALIAAQAGVDIARNNGATPICVASEMGHIDIVGALIVAHAGVDIALDNGMTPLYAACMFGHTDIVRSLIAAGAGVNIAEARGRTPLDVAIHYSHESITNALIEAGAANGPEADDWSVEDSDSEAESDAE